MGAADAVAIWKELVESIAVLAPASARAGRKLKLTAEPALYTLATSLGIASSQLPHTGFSSYAPPSPFLTKSPSNILIAASFGHLIPSSLLDLFDPLNALNVHPSLLPKYRGAAPIQWAIINRDRETGPIPNGADFNALEPVLAKEGADLLVEILRDLPNAQRSATSQDSTRASLAPKLTKPHSRIDWSSPRPSLLALQRGLSHQLPLWSTLDNIPLQLKLDFSPVPESDTTNELLASEPGTVRMDKNSQSQLPVTPALMKGEATRTSSNAVSRAWTWVTSSLLSPILAKPVVPASAPSPTSKLLLSTRRTLSPTLSTFLPTSQILTPAILPTFDVILHPTWPVPSPARSSLVLVTKRQMGQRYARRYWKWRRGIYGSSGAYFGGEGSSGSSAAEDAVAFYSNCL
ncbi:hypothetical protein RQP46_006078 [Phenoliferia psychrophenolica]